MDPIAAVVLAIFVIMILVLILAVPVICTVFTIGVIKRTSRFAFKSKYPKK